MLYMVHSVVTIEAGDKLIAAEGGPGALMKHLIERFKPRSVFVSTTRRENWMLIDFESPARMAEFMLIASSRFGNYPTFTPVVPGEEYPAVSAEAIQAALAAP
jgi:hypothetical protein